MSVSIKVAIRCRPFSVDDKLGVKMHQASEEEGEVELINCDYSTKRFPFTYSWWSAYGYKRHLVGETIIRKTITFVAEWLAAGKETFTGELFPYND